MEKYLKQTIDYYIEYILSVCLYLFIYSLHHLVCDYHHHHHRFSSMVWHIEMIPPSMLNMNEWKSQPIKKKETNGIFCFMFLLKDICRSLYIFFLPCFRLSMYILLCIRLIIINQLLRW